MAREQDLGKGRIGLLLFQMAMPAIVAQVINALYNIVDRMYIGHIADIGATALTGVGVAFPIIMLVSAFSMLVGMGGAPRAAIRMGAGDDEGAEKILGNCFVSLIGISVLLTAFILIWQKDMLLMFGANADTTLRYGLEYLSIYAFGTIFVQIVLGLNMFINAQGFPKIGMLTVVIGAVINIVLDPILIFGLHMGVQGAALATVISQAVSAVWVLAFLFGKKGKLRIQKRYFKLDPKVILPVIALGISPFIMQSTESVLSVCFNVSLRDFGGDTAIGAMTILTSVMQFAMMPLQGLTQGAQPIISYNYGANQPDRVKATFKLLLITCIAFSTVVWAVCMFLPGLPVAMFSNTPELTTVTKWALQIYMAVSLIFGIQIACQQTFIALNQAKVSVFLAVLRKIILLIPLIFILPAIVPHGLSELFVTTPVAEILTKFDPEKTFAVFLAEPIADFIAVTVTSIMFATQFNKILSKPGE